MESFDKLTDLHIKDNDVSASIAYPGPRGLTIKEAEVAGRILERCQEINKKDFMVTLDGLFWRGRYDAFSVDGCWYRLRKMPEKPYNLDCLPSEMPSVLKSMLLSRTLRNGGLIYVVGSPGSGKTTTASAILVSRLLAFGGAGYTIEEPPEIPLNGWHGAGYCTQTQVAGDSSTDWVEAFRCVLRSQPVGENLILYVGEVRDAESAQAMLRAASNGFLVIATGFGSDIISGTDALIKLAGAYSANSLAALLRIVIHQRIIDSVMIPSVLVSKDGATVVAQRIRAGQLQHLTNDIQFQSNQIRLGRNPLEDPV